MEPLLFSRNPPISERDVWNWANRVEQGDASAKEPLTEFIRHRLKRRYLTPLSKVPRKFQSGFLMMGAGCLLIETLHSFRMGWNNTDRKSEEAFISFFEYHAVEFPSLRTFFPIIPKPGIPGKNTDTFYKHIRCGLLHQAETTGGYSIVRDGSKMFSDKVVNADKFIRALRKCVEKYERSLVAEPGDSHTWQMAIVKVRHICQNFRSGR